ncbi:MAG TPA: chemotaxis protein CheW, partial [Planctomycetota bacterium]|nr:chemotaxis protein CheW [Planctomycetota bacterium]
MTRAATKDMLQAVSFRLGKEEYALEITQVKEVIMPAGIMRMPQTAAFNVGVINLRGSIIPVIDLRLRLGVGEATTDDHTRILIAKPGGRVVGLVVDAVSQVMKVPRDEVVPPPPTIVGAARR